MPCGSWIEQAAHRTVVRRDYKMTRTHGLTTIGVTVTAATRHALSRALDRVWRFAARVVAGWHVTRLADVQAIEPGAVDAVCDLERVRSRGEHEIDRREVVHVFMKGLPEPDVARA